MAHTTATPDGKPSLEKRPEAGDQTVGYPHHGMRLEQAATQTRIDEHTANEMKG
ncbi:MAG: hypothetical protein IPP50_13930 [Piscinibacter sp.]|nr:hypothetical protein [Piscinibacter sp.]